MLTDGDLRDSLLAKTWEVVEHAIFDAEHEDPSPSARSTTVSARTSCSLAAIEGHFALVTMLVAASGCPLQDEFDPRDYDTVPCLSIPLEGEVADPTAPPGYSEAKTFYLGLTRGSRFRKVLRSLTIQLSLMLKHLARGGTLVMQWYGVVHHPTFFFLLRHFTDYFIEVSIEVDEDDTTNLGIYVVCRGFNPIDELTDAGLDVDLSHQGNSLRRRKFTLKRFLDGFQHTDSHADDVLMWMLSKESLQWTVNKYRQALDSVFAMLEPRLRELAARGGKPKMDVTVSSTDGQESVTKGSAEAAEIGPDRGAPSSNGSSSSGAMVAASTAIHDADHSSGRLHELPARNVGEERRPPSNISVRPIGDTVAVVEVGTDGRAPLAIDSRSIGDTATPFIPTEGVGHASGDLYDVPAVQPGSGGRASLPPGVRCTDDAAPPFMSSEGLDHAFDNLRGVSVVEIGSNGGAPLLPGVRSSGDSATSFTSVEDADNPFDDPREASVVETGADGRVPLSIGFPSVEDVAAPFMPTEGADHTLGDLREIAAGEGVRSSDDTAAPFMTTEDLDYPSGDLREVSAQEFGTDGRAPLSTSMRSIDDAAPPFMPSARPDHAFDNLPEIPVPEVGSDERAALSLGRRSSEGMATSLTSLEDADHSPSDLRTRGDDLLGAEADVRDTLSTDVLSIEERTALFMPTEGADVSDDLHIRPNTFLAVRTDGRDPALADVCTSDDTVAPLMPIDGTNHVRSELCESSAVEFGTDGRVQLSTGVRSFDDATAPFVHTEGADNASGDLHEVPIVEVGTDGRTPSSLAVRSSEDPASTFTPMEDADHTSNVQHARADESSLAGADGRDPLSIGEDTATPFMPSEGADHASDDLREISSMRVGTDGRAPVSPAVRYSEDTATLFTSTKDASHPSGDPLEVSALVAGTDERAVLSTGMRSSEDMTAPYLSTAGANRPSGDLPEVPVGEVETDKRPPLPLDERSIDDISARFMPTEGVDHAYDDMSAVRVVADGRPPLSTGVHSVGDTAASLMRSEGADHASGNLRAVSVAEVGTDERALLKSSREDTATSFMLIGGADHSSSNVRDVSAMRDMADGRASSSIGLRHIEGTATPFMSAESLRHPSGDSWAQRGRDKILPDVTRDRSGLQQRLGALRSPRPPEKERVKRQSKTKGKRKISHEALPKKQGSGHMKSPYAARASRRAEGSRCKRRPRAKRKPLYRVSAEAPPLSRPVEATGKAIAHSSSQYPGHAQTKSDLFKPEAHTHPPWDPSPLTRLPVALSYTFQIPYQPEVDTSMAAKKAVVDRIIEPTDTHAEDIMARYRNRAYRWAVGTDEDSPRDRVGTKGSVDRSN